jgi:isocitrate dehydrogenase
MSTEKSRSKDPDILASKNALQRAAKRALRIGLETGTPVWVIKKGRIVDLTKGHRRHRPKKQRST